MNRTRAIALAALFTLGPWGAPPSTAAPPHTFHLAQRATPCHRGASALRVALGGY